jgi:hypothetical protein
MRGEIMTWTLVFQIIVLMFVGALLLDILISTWRKGK